MKMTWLFTWILISTSAFAFKVDGSHDSFLLRCKGQNGGDYSGAPSGWYNSEAEAYSAGAKCPYGILGVTKKLKVRKLDKK